MTYPRIQVLLSTYNGMAYLEEQFDSLFAQIGVDLSVLVRDDGSSDGTPALLEDYARKEPRLRLLKDKNIGVVRSFFELLREAEDGFEYYAFCDQDDVWLQGKLSRAVEMLSRLSPDSSRLYCSRLRYVDKELRELGLSRIPRHLDFSSALVENVATGCTLVFDKKLLDTALPGLDPKHCLMHDWWLYLLAQGTGAVVFDLEAHVLYRQHENNVVGASANFCSRYLTKIRRFLKRGADASYLSDQVRAFVGAYRPVLNANDRDLALKFLASKKSFGARLAWALRLPTRRHSWLDNMILRILIIFGRY